MAAINQAAKMLLPRNKNATDKITAKQLREAPRQTNLRNTIGANSKGSSSAYSDIDQASINTAASYVNNGGMGNILDAAGKKGNTTWNRSKNMGSWGMAGYAQEAHKEGYSALGLAGKHALQGGVFGGIAGGSVEASQGGSFWDGAKSGAFNGAVGSVGVRGLKRATGADSYLFGQNSIAKQGSAMWRSTSSNGAVSKQATAILTERNMTALARQTMNQSKKG